MIAIIPARGGSKGVPGKNIKELCGKPLIAHTIEAAISSNEVDKVIVSTDDQEVAKIAIAYGAEVPFMRPKELATDEALAINNYIYTINKLNGMYCSLIESFAVLQPTSPLRAKEDIDKAINIFNEKNADSVISVVKLPYSISWAKAIDEKGVLVNYYNDNEKIKNRQDYKATYIPNGAIYVFKTNLILNNQSYYSELTFPYIMPRDRSVDIDEIIDFQFAEFLMRKRDEGNRKI